MSQTTGIQILMLQFSQRSLVVLLQSMRRSGQTSIQKSWSSLAWGQLWLQLHSCAVAQRSWDATGRGRREHRKVDMRPLCSHESTHTCTREAGVIEVKFNLCALKLVFKANCKPCKSNLRPVNRKTVVLKSWNRLQQQTYWGMQQAWIAPRNIWWNKMQLSNQMNELLVTTFANKRITEYWLKFSLNFM